MYTFLVCDWYWKLLIANVLVPIRLIVHPVPEENVLGKMTQAFGDDTAFSPSPWPGWPALQSSGPGGGQEEMGSFCKNETEAERKGGYEAATEIGGF